MAQEKVSNIKSLEEVKNESTCQKRVVICTIYNEEGTILARESNRCSPTGGTCHRLDISQGKEGYDVNSHCNWTHAEIMAINSLPEGSKPYKAVIHGHSFFCESCEKALAAIGINNLEVI